MKADVIHQFTDAQTGETVPAGAEVDMEQSRLETLERKKCVRRKTHKAPAVEQEAEQAQEEPKPTKKPRGRPRKKKAE